MRQIFIVFLLLLFVVTGCVTKQIEKTFVGKLITADVVPTAWNSPLMMRIETEKGIYIIVGITFFEKGEEIFIVKNKIKGYRILK